ncbi:MAG: uracil-DNA glycosylase [Holosporaceae bacterium]|jgi:DNA polymerase|nr:uracil-DNA glycosylase [Holosporaceae bacterium]
MKEKEFHHVLEWFLDAGVSDITSNERFIPGETKKEISTLAELKEVIAQIDTPLKNCALNIVFGVGNEKADLLLLGEAPGAEEDKYGVPFVGQSGKLLDKILASVGLDRTEVYITNILPWRPPGNRTPTNQEIELFRPYVLQHIALIDPKVIICLGGTATKALLQTSQGIVQLRGKKTKIDAISAEIIPTFHPAYLLRSPSQKREVWLDFLNAVNVVGCVG